MCTFATHIHMKNSLGTHYIWCPKVHFYSIYECFCTPSYSFWVKIYSRIFTFASKNYNFLHKIQHERLYLLLLVLSKAQKYNLGISRLVLLIYGQNKVMSKCPLSHHAWYRGSNFGSNHLLNYSQSRFAPLSDWYQATLGARNHANFYLKSCPTIFPRAADVKYSRNMMS